MQSSSNLPPNVRPLVNQTPGNPTAIFQDWEVEVLGAMEQDLTNEMA